MRDALLCASIAFGAATVLFTEGLSQFGAIRPVPAATAWASVVACASFAAWRNRARRPMLSMPRGCEIWFPAATIAAMGGLAALIGVTALVSAPNSADAMAYHLPRVFYWIQHADVALYPTHYLNQVMLQPFAEYLTLQTWLVSGGDQFANMPQFCSYLLCIAGASMVARELGAGARGQVLAAVTCATLPNVVLQASGAKNDLALTAALVLFLYFGLRYGADRRRDDLAYAAIAGALALFTKGTAYLFLPPLALVVVGWSGDRKRTFGKLAAAGAAATLLLNGPFYARNVRLSGSPLGFDSAHADGLFRWQNEPLSLRATASNLLRHASEQLGARSQAWNRGVYDAVVKAHDWLGTSPNDPSTTWRWTRFEPPRNANHESNKNNRLHLMLYLACCVWAATLAPTRRLLALPAALGLGMLLFAFYLKWQPFQIRMLAPLYVLAAPFAGLMLARAHTALQVLVCIFLFDGSRLPATENWARPLEGVHSIFAIDRSEGYLADLTPWENGEAYLQAVDWVAESGCRDVGLDLSEYQIEYPLIALLREIHGDTVFRHVNVRNPSRGFESANPSRPCAVVCMECAAVGAKRELYGSYPTVREKDGFLVFQ